VKFHKHRPLGVAVSPIRHFRPFASWLLVILNSFPYASPFSRYGGTAGSQSNSAI
jgi:hypothetical protein